MSKATNNKITLIEEEIFGGAPQIDTEAGIIRGVKVLGRSSKNGREYSDNALAQAAKLYEGCPVNLSHNRDQAQEAERAFHEGIGWLKGPVIREDGVYADLHYIKAHSQAAVLVESAQRNPKRFGLSQNAQGGMKRVGNKNIVESIDRLFSVDIVQRPATTAGLFESEDPDKTSEEKTVKIALKQFVAGIDAKQAERGWMQKLLEMDEMSGIASAPVDAAPSDMSADDQAKAAFEAMVSAVVKDDKLDLAAKKKKIGEILGMQDKLLNAGKPEKKPAEGGEGGGDAKDKDASESEKIAKARSQQAEELLEAAGIKAEPAKVKALAALTETADRKSLIESWRPAVKPEVRKPVSSKPLYESDEDPNAKYPGDHKSFLSSITK